VRLDWLKHAFAVEKADDFAPTDAQKQISEKICQWIVKRRLTTPTIMAIEASRGLNYLGANMMHFFRPAVAALLDTREYQQFATMLEHRGSMDYLCRLIEQFEKERTTEDTEGADESGNETTDKHG
jgi:hypothetical protein